MELPKKHSIHFFGDTHYGHRSVRQAMINSLIDEVNGDSSAFAWHMGDVAEAITINDKRYHREEHGVTLPDPVLQYAKAREDFVRMKGLVGFLQGNHDEKLAKRGAGDVLREVARATELSRRARGRLFNVRDDGTRDYDVAQNLVYGTYSTMLIVHAGDLEYKAFLWHGSGSPPASNAKDPLQRMANTLASAQNKLAKQFSDPHVMGLGHYHRIWSWRAPPETILWVDGNRVRQDRQTSEVMDVAEFQGRRHINPHHRWYFCSGTAKKSREAFGVPKGTGIGEDDAFDTWEATKGFPPADLGHVVLRYDHGRLWVESRFWEGGE